MYSTDFKVIASDNLYCNFQLKCYILSEMRMSFRFKTKKTKHIFVSKCKLLLDVLVPPTTTLNMLPDPSNWVLTR